MPKVTLIEPEGTYLLWLDFSAYGLSDEDLDDIIINDANLWLDSGHIFGKAGRGFPAPQHRLPLEHARRRP